RGAGRQLSGRGRYPAARRRLSPAYRGVGTAAIGVGPGEPPNTLFAIGRLVRGGVDSAGSCRNTPDKAHQGCGRFSSGREAASHRNTVRPASPIPDGGGGICALCALLVMDDGT